MPDRGCGTRYEDSVANAAARSSVAVVRTAVLVMNSGSVPLLCPFFEKCDGIFLTNSADGSKEFRPCDRSSAKSAHDVILKLKPDGLSVASLMDQTRGSFGPPGLVQLFSCRQRVDGTAFHAPQAVRQGKPRDDRRNATHQNELGQRFLFTIGLPPVASFVCETIVGLPSRDIKDCVIAPLSRVFYRKLIPMLRFFP